MRESFVIVALFGIAALTGCTTANPELMGNLHQELSPESFYLPNAELSRVVSVATNGAAAADIVVQTHRVAVKETGPKETVAAFGEVYAYSPNFFAVRREEPTVVRFWNLQPDDNHRFMLIDPHGQFLMSLYIEGAEGGGRQRQRPLANPGRLPPDQPNLLNLEQLRRYPSVWTARSLRREAQGRYTEGEPQVPSRS